MIHCHYQTDNRGKTSAQRVIFVVTLFFLQQATNAQVIFQRTSDGRIEQMFNPRANGAVIQETLDDENANQLEQLEAQLRAEIQVTPAPYSFHSVNNAPYATIVNPQRNNIRPVEIATAFGLPTQNAKTALNFNILQNGERGSSASKYVDMDMKNIASNPYQEQHPFINNNVGLENSVSTFVPSNTGNTSVGNANNAGSEDIFVDALKQVLVEFKRNMMRGKFGRELKHKAERLNQDLKYNNNNIDNNHVDELNVGTRPHLPLRQKWGVSGINSRFSGRPMIDDTVDFRRKPIFLGSQHLWMNRAYTVLPSRLGN